MFGADENARPGYDDPRQAAETCSMVEFMHSFQMLVAMTGDPVWADRCEEVAFNDFPASQTADLKSLHYLTAPNMPRLDKDDKSPGLQNSGTMLSYDPHGYRCCQHNVSHGWPYYAEHLWMAAPGNGLAAMLYAESVVSATVGDGVQIRITESTGYPFSEVIEFTLSPERAVEFPIFLRVPGWCESARVEINGRAVGTTPLGAQRCGNPHTAHVHPGRSLAGEPPGSFRQPWTTDLLPRDRRGVAAVRRH